MKYIIKRGEFYMFEPEEGLWTAHKENAHRFNSKNAAEEQIPIDPKERYEIKRVRK